MATENQIKAVVKKQLKSFNSVGVEVDDDTVISSAIRGQRAEDLFRGNVLWTLDTNKHVPSSGGKNRFPGSWRDMSVSALAKALLSLLLIFITAVSFAQVTVNLGTSKTDLRNSALNFAFSYIRSMDSVINQYHQINGKHSYLAITPDVKVSTGTSDAFSSIIAKASGLFTSFHTTTVEGLVTPEADRTMNVFPVSVGVESNNQFTFINAIAEAGYEPYWQSPLHRGSSVLQHVNWGVWLQAGYKWHTGADTASLFGGATDESKETSSIFRAKTTLAINTARLININGFGLGLVGDAGLWYDLLHGAVYYRVNGAARIYLTNTAYFDIFYQKGSGAPNFNTGDQFGTGLTIIF
jgi:hypothetical protein